MVKIRTPQEVRAAYDIQIRALEASCSGYDAGNTWEAIRIATSIYVLVNDGGRKNQSLITRLGLRRKIKFLASGPKTDPRIVFFQPLVGLHAQRNPDNSRTVVFVPLLGSKPEDHRWISRDDWWSRDTIYRNGPRTITRKQLVFALRNQEGGAHYDHLSDKGYIEYANSPAWTFTLKDEAPQKVYGIEHATMRQIAWEILETLKVAG